LPPTSDLERLVRVAQSEHRFPSISARVVVRGEPALELAIGTADDGAGRDATPDTQYRVGSITKTFTAAAVMALVDEGKVGLDDPLGKHVPAAGDRPLTIRRMLSHASGLQREPVGNVWETFAFPTMDELLASLDEAEQVLEQLSSLEVTKVTLDLLKVQVEDARRREARENATEELEQGFRDALVRHDWHTARELVRALEETAPESARPRQMLAEISRQQEIEQRQQAIAEGLRAFDGYLRAGQVSQAEVALRVLRQMGAGDSRVHEAEQRLAETKR